MGHLIHRQILELKFASQHEAQRWSPRFSELNRRIILPELDQVFSELTVQQTLRIDRLEIDLGQLRQESLEQDLIACLRQKVEEALRPYLQLQPLEERVVAASPILDSEGQSYLAKDNMLKLDSNSLEQLFKQFLYTGQVPWWLKQELVSQLDALYQRFWEQAPGRARELVLETIIGPTELLRFVEQFSNQSHHLTLLELLPPVSGTLLVDLRKLAVYLLARLGFGLQARAISYKLAYGLIAISKQQQLDQPQVLARQFFFTLAQVSGVSATQLREEVDATVARLRLTSATRAVLAELLRETPAIDQLRTLYRRMETSVSAEELVKEQPLAAAEGLEVYIENAGLVLLWPHLKELFQTLEVFDELDDGTLRPKFEAVLLLQQLVTGNPAGAEGLLLLNKLLCGLPPTAPIPRRCRRSKSWDSEVEKLLSVVVRQWAVLKNTSVDGLRKSFLQREGILREQGEGWTLQVERKAHDILLEQLPWGIGMIRLSWMSRPLAVEW